MSRLMEIAKHLESKNARRNPSYANPVAPSDCKYCYFSQHVFSYDGGHIRCTADVKNPNPDTCKIFLREPGSDDDRN